MKKVFGGLENLVEVLPYEKLIVELSRLAGIIAQKYKMLSAWKNTTGGDRKERIPGTTRRGLI